MAVVPAPYARLLWSDARYKKRGRHCGTARQLRLRRKHGTLNLTPINSRRMMRPGTLSKIALPKESSPRIASPATYGLVAHTVCSHITQRWPKALSESERGGAHNLIHHSRTLSVSRLMTLLTYSVREHSASSAGTGSGTQPCLPCYRKIAH